MDHFRPRGGAHRTDRPVGQLVHPVRHVDGSHSRGASTVRGPVLVSVVTSAVLFRDTSPASTPTAHRPRPYCGALDHVGCHASRSMRPRICRKRLPVKWPPASWRMKYRACRVRRPPILKSRCWRLVSDQLRMARGRTSLQQRLFETGGRLVPQARYFIITPAGRPSRARPRPARQSREPRSGESGYLTTTGGRSRPSCLRCPWKSPVK